MGSAPVWELTRIRTAAEAQAGRIAAMVAGADDLAIMIPRSQWSVAEAAAHLAFTTIGLAMMARGLAIPYGDGTREGLAEANAGSLDGYSERHGPTLARELIDNTKMAFDEAEAQPADQVCPTPMGEVGVDGLVAYVLTHQAMHGSAIATAFGAPPPFEPDDVELMWPFIRHVLPRVVDRAAIAGLTACAELVFTDRFRICLMFSNGTVHAAEAPTRPVDCRISGDARSLFLVLVKILRLEEATASGGLRVDGPRPELGRRLADLFDIP